MPRLLLWLERHPSTTSCMFQRQRAGSDTTAVGKWTQQPPDIWQHPQERLSKWNYSQLAWPQGHTTGTSGEADFPKYTNILTPPKMSLLYSKIQAINIKTSELLRSRVQFSVPVLMTYLVFFFVFFTLRHQNVCEMSLLAPTFLCFSAVCKMLPILDAKETCNILRQQLNDLTCL